MAISGMVGEERERVLAVCQESNSPGWVDRFGARVPRAHGTVEMHERDATGISVFESVRVPVLVQTPDYARALACLSTASADDVGERQQVLDQRKRFAFFVHEFALRMLVGSRRVMSEQLHALLRVSVLPQVSLRVIRAKAGGHAGIAGPFELLEFAGARPVAYVEGETAGLFLEEPMETAAYQAILVALAEVALSAEESRKLIAWTATEFYRTGE